MLIDVEDPPANLILNACFYGLLALTVLSLIPWRIRDGRNRWAKLLPLAALGIYTTDETAMPVRYDIRLDLVLIAPMGLVIGVSWLARLVLWRRGVASR